VWDIRVYRILFYLNKFHNLLSTWGKCLITVSKIVLRPMPTSKKYVDCLISSGINTNWKFGMIWKRKTLSLCDFFRDHFQWKWYVHINILSCDRIPNLRKTTQTFAYCKLHVLARVILITCWFIQECMYEHVREERENRCDSYTFIT